MSVNFTEIDLSIWHFTVKLACAKLPANAGNFIWRPPLKKPPTQLTCVTCSIPVEKGNFPCVCAASTPRRIHANCLQPHVNLLEYRGYFTGNFTGTWQAKTQAICKQSTAIARKIPAIASKNTRNCRRKHPQLRPKIPETASNAAITPQVNSPAKCN